MYKIGRRLVLSKTSKRKIAMLNYLLAGPKTIQDTAKHIHASEKTVRRLLAILEDELPSEIKVEILRSSVLILQVSDYFVFSSLMKSWAGDSPLFNVVEALFYSEKLTITEYADQLFLSESSTRTYLKLLKNIVEEYNLTLKLSPVVILIGKEADVRYFYFHFFHYSGELATESPQYQINAKGLYDYLDYLALEYQIPLYVDYSRVLLWMFVIETRLSQGNTVIIDEKIITQYWNTSYFQQYMKAFQLFFSTNEIWKNSSKSELVYAYITRLSTVVYEDGKVYFVDEYIEELEKYHGIVSEFFSQYQLNRVVYSELEFKLKAFLTNLSFLTDTTVLHQRLGVEAPFPETYAPIYNLWEELLENSDWKFKHDVATSLSYLTCTSLMQRDYNYKNVLFVLTGEPVLIPYYKGIIHRLLPHEASAHFLFNKPVSNELLQALDIDIIVTNVIIDQRQVDRKRCELIRLSDNPNEKEWEALVEKLYRV